MSLIKQRVRELSRYEVPQDAQMVKLNQNEFPRDVPDQFKREILARLAAASWQRYPDGEAGALVTAIAAYAGVPAECVLVGNASNELIQTVISATCESGDTIVTVTPGFAVYSRVARILGACVREVPLRADFSCDPEALVAAAHGARLVIFATPNNPTGTWMAVSDIEELVARVDCLVCVDEAYFEFHGETALPLLRSYSNLVLLRTFSKALRLAGARLGYLLGPPQVVAELAKARLPFSVGILQQIAGEVMLAHRKLLEKEIQEVVCQREELLAVLPSISGVQAVPSRANFVLFRHQAVPAATLFSALRRRGVLVRSFGDALSDWLRVTVGTPAENQAFLAALRASLVELA
ncbi:MAG: histidinol-phosphate transaminase [bacterium]|jgi:histidinol-phosphate aminotransferase|nr:histidinol-phosphate transaminase [candidate division KSB1 bacterium]MDH7560749.1 histidinol-phosphate transaminase [bacterium]